MKLRAPMFRSVVTHRRQSSQEAEEFVACELARQSWQILGRNIRHHGYELDIVARKGATLIIVEVKARRRQLDQARGFEMLLSHRKRQALLRGVAAIFGRFGGGDVETVRIDLALVIGCGSTRRIEYFVSAVEI
jgi:Holliday junction resolvase-like predicted endonuclease